MLAPPRYYGASWIANAINAAGDIVGKNSCAGYRVRNGIAAELNYLLLGADWLVSNASDINDRGQILAEAYLPGTDVRAIVLLTPGS